MSTLGNPPLGLFYRCVGCECLHWEQDGQIAQDFDMGKVRLSVGKVAWCLIDRSFYIVQHCLRK